MFIEKNFITLFFVQWKYHFFTQKVVEMPHLARIEPNAAGHIKLYFLPYSQFYYRSEIQFCFGEYPMDLKPG